MSGLASDPFGQQPAPWWRRWRRPSERHAPKRYARITGAMGPVVLFLWSGHGLDRPARIAIAMALLFAPSWLLEV
jgi:hypothetical protein